MWILNRRSAGWGKGHSNFKPKCFKLNVFDKVFDPEWLVGHILSNICEKFSSIKWAYSFNALPYKAMVTSLMLKIIQHFELFYDLYIHSVLLNFCGK